MKNNKIIDIGKKFMLIFLISAFVFIGAVILLSTMMTATAEPQVPNAGWITVFSDSFESDLSSWDVSEGGSGVYYWATTSYTTTDGSQSAWATGGGSDGSALDPGVDNYPNNALSSMIYGPVDLTGTVSARLSFDYWTDTEPAFDVLRVGVSLDGISFDQVDVFDGNSNGWQSRNLDLSAYAGETQVWVQFLFSSNANTNAKGVFIDNVKLESLTEQLTYLPIVRKDPTPTPTATPAYLYFDDFSNPSSGWPVVDHTHVSNDCFKWFYENGRYKVDICDDRTDVKVSPLVRLPNGDYEIEVDARFRESGGWWDAYGILFDAKDDPDPNKPNLGDYYMLWVLWEGEDRVLYKILKDVPGDQEDLFDWVRLRSDTYNYDNRGTSWNHWKIVRTSNEISIYLNGHHLRSVNEPRPTTNNQYLFGVYASTYETHPVKIAFDNYLVREVGTSSSNIMYSDFNVETHPYVISGEFDLDEFLPDGDE